jgi:hypothetical protein
MGCGLAPRLLDEHWRYFMDRSDEFERGHTHDHTHDDSHDEPERDRPVREGDILGLGGAAVPKTAGDPSADYDEDSKAQRRARARADEAEHRTTGASADTKGATGIDMGAGGHGTDVSGE